MRCSMTTSLARSIALAAAVLLLLALGLPAIVEAQPARIAITVTDPGGQPLSDVKVLVTNAERGDVKVEAVTNKKGKATLMVPNVALSYDFALSLDGYASLETDVKPEVGQTTFREYELVPAGGAPAAAPAPGAAKRVYTPAELAFNE